MENLNCHLQSVSKCLNILLQGLIFNPGLIRKLSFLFGFGCFLLYFILCFSFPSQDNFSIVEWFSRPLKRDIPCFMSFHGKNLQHYALRELIVNQLMIIQASNYIMYHNVPHTVLNTLYIITHEFLKALCERYFYSTYFTKEETEAQRIRFLIQGGRTNRGGGNSSAQAIWLSNMPSPYCSVLPDLCSVFCYLKNFSSVVYGHAA